MNLFPVKRERWRREQRETRQITKWFVRRCYNSRELPHSRRLTGSYLKQRVPFVVKDPDWMLTMFQNVLQLFISQAANVFLLDTSGESAQLLEEQVDICKRVLNMYRYMVMHTHMEMKTWWARLKKIETTRRL